MTDEELEILYSLQTVHIVAVLVTNYGADMYHTNKFGESLLELSIKNDRIMMLALYKVR